MFCCLAQKNNTQIKQKGPEETEPVMHKREIIPAVNQNILPVAEPDAHGVWVLLKATIVQGVKTVTSVKPYRA